MKVHTQIRAFRDAHPLDDIPATVFDNGNGYRMLIGSHGVKATLNDPLALLNPSRTFDTLQNDLVGGVYFAFSKYQVMPAQQPVFEHGVDPSFVVLCHMGPSGDDPDYQERMLRRGAYVQYDMVGMEVFYADQGVQCPSDEENARRIADLMTEGFGSRVLISQDVFLKSLLRHHGGPGYSHILQYFVPRLLRLGLDDDDVQRLLVHNPRELFESR